MAAINGRHAASMTALDALIPEGFTAGHRQRKPPEPDAVSRAVQAPSRVNRDHPQEAVMSDQSTVIRSEPFHRFSAAHLAAVGFLARYSGWTRDAYGADLRTYLGWCATRQLDVFIATRPHIEIYTRWLEEDRRLVPATVARRLSTVIGFYRFMVIDGRLDKPPAQYVRRPRVSVESQALPAVVRRWPRPSPRLS
jgi:Phage integrase, N-terminal SAM-like domain